MRALVGEQFAMAFFAISLSIVLCEAATSQCIHTERAHEVFRVPFLIEGIDASASNWFATTCAERSCLLMVMNLTVWFASKFEEAASSK
jgi:hypothetical protein